jgi:hypothetical protein
VIVLTIALITFIRDRLKAGTPVKVPVVDNKKFEGE